MFIYDKFLPFYSSQCKNDSVNVKSNQGDDVLNDVLNATSVAHNMKCLQKSLAKPVNCYTR